MSLERRRLLKVLGAELVLTPAEKGMPGAIAAAEQLVAETPDAVMLQQFEAQLILPFINQLQQRKFGRYRWGS